MEADRAFQLQVLRDRMARIEGRDGRARGVLPFGDPRVDDCLPGGGLPLGRWHELVGEGMDVETGVSAAARVARTMSPTKGKSRDCRPSPYTGSGSPVTAARQKRWNAMSGRWRGP
jgi:protein ImuA